MSVLLVFIVCSLCVVLYRPNVTFALHISYQNFQMFNFPYFFSIKMSYTVAIYSSQILKF